MPDSIDWSCLELEIRRFTQRSWPMNVRRAGIISAIAILAATAAVAQEKKIKRSDLPPAVEKTVAAQSAGATIKGVSTQNEKGQTFYKAQMVVNCHIQDTPTAATTPLVAAQA